MIKGLKITGIITIIIGVILTILQLVTQAGISLEFADIGVILGGILIQYVFYGVICLGLAKIIELLEKRK
ncbi:hypothetical protein C6499_19350 [Candidatus Poribacteria bacterium]|nr:MAG: hypothetical protein C6499_19350 [Candidatus Poribacteria bacterium]